ncbi:MAG: efflux RND transporter periplasmic adaptor subunit [Pseudomonadales bacterium]|nr:efflux RND transporter periplasmic adaptor subunit [Pseudomonadales bacterium]
MSAEAIAEPITGPNGGRLLTDGDFALELAIFETGVPPEYHAWASRDGTALPPQTVDLQVRLTRLGGIVDTINFVPQNDMLRGDTVIYEPHSFIVTINAEHAGQRYQWQYESFEGRTRIEPAVREALGIATEVAGPAVIEQTVTAYGQITHNTAGLSPVSARFEGTLKAVHATIGERVIAGQVLADIESNQSLNNYRLEAPISGLVIERNANPGEQTNGRQLFTILDTSTVWADIAVFPADQAAVAVGAPVEITTARAAHPRNGTIAMILPRVQANQAVTARVVLENEDGALIPGTWVTAQIKVGEFEVPLAVRREGLQSFRDFTVVYAQIGDEYEVRMLDLGRQSGEWVEVLGGLSAGTRYVTQNSYILKADIEKSGASHDH